MPNVLLTFEDLQSGDVVNGQYYSDGVTISSGNPANPPMVFDSSNPTGGDSDLHTNNLGNVLILSEDGDSSDPDDNAGGGKFIFEFDEPSEVVNFRALDIEEGGTVRLYNEDGQLIKTVQISTTGNNGQVTVDIDADNVARMEVEINGSGAIDNVCYVTPESLSELDGVVEGSAGDDVIDVAYDGDPDGDMIDANDEILPGEGPNDDIVDAFGGDDTITSGEGDDEVYAGSGDDTVDGGAGDDIIYGDSNYSGPGAGTTVRESLNWDEAPNFGNNNDANGFTQDTGSVNVTFSILSETGNAETEFETDDQLVSGIDSGSETIENNSSLYSVTNGDSGRANYELSFSDPVENVEFRINDIDGDGVVRIRAYDADNNPIVIELDVGSRLTLSNTDGVAGADTMTSDGGYASDTSPHYSALVTIPGPVSRIEILHDQVGNDNTGINVTDVFFDAPSVVDNGADGNDTLRGGDGNDVIYGEGGNDRLEGGTGDDTLDGGDGNDVILGGAGNDTADGGAGNEEIWMGSGNDTVEGGDGNDWIHGQTGDDTLSGGAGDDMIFGEDGDDRIEGGDGADAILGGSGRDTIVGGNDGDTVDGGTTGDDYDVLDLTGEGPFRVVNETVDADGDSTSGTVEFLDSNGDVTGSLQFAEIEKIIGDRVNQGPDANDDTANVDEDDSVIIDVLGNDTDPENDDLTVIDATSPDGEVVINADGTITFTPADNFNGETTISYTIEDEAGNTDTATVTVTVEAVNDDPVANDDTASTDEDTPVDINVLGNDTDVDGDDLTVTEATSPDGDVVINPDGTLTFTPAENFNGDTTIIYTISDGNGGEDTATVNVTVNAVNDDPVANDDAYTTDEDTEITVSPLDNDSDVDGDTLTITEITQPANGAAVLNADGTITYTPNDDFAGEDTITYTVSDGNGGTDTATVTFTVSGVNDGPDAVDDEASTNNLTPVVIPVLANDTDPENDALTVTEASVDVGSVVINPDGTLSYTPEADFGGVATITYTITDGNGGFDTATVSVNVLDGIVEGTAGDDLIDVGYTGDPEGDMIDNNDEFLPGEGPQDDIVLAGDGDDTVLAGEGNDEVYGEEGDDTLYGNAGDDYLSGGEGNDIIYGGDGNDELDAGQGGDELYGEDGDDLLLGGPGTDLLDGGAGNDDIRGGNSADVILGGTGDDTINGEDGEDDIQGNEGEDFILGGAGDDVIDGGDDDDQIYGEDGDDELYGGAGDDYLSGGNGDDVLYGGTGNDDLDAGQDGDTLFGEEGDDNLDGGAREDYLDGGTGDDTISGGNADDIIIGGDGNDTVSGDDGDDIIDTGRTGIPLPDLGYPGLFPADANPNDDIDFVDGGAGDDVISTGDDADTIFGGTGNDTIDGGIDADTIDGGEGDDRIVGGEGSDVINAGDGDDVVYAGIDPDLGLPDNLDIADVDGDLVPNNGMDLVNGGDGNDTIFGADDDDTLNGDAGDDYIDGGVDDDTITGGTGNDTIIGGQGADDMSGGDDRDTFLVGSAGDGVGDVVDGGTGGDDVDTLDLTGSGPMRIVGETVDADGDSTSGTVEFLDGVGGDVIGTLQFTEIENIVPCFTPGTSIATPRGEVLVEDLMVGDKIITRDNGIQEIRWIGAKRMDGRELQNNPHLQPVLIQKGSLGNGLPERDMLVSPNHRMLVNNDRVALYFEENEVLVSAKHLVNPSVGVQSIASMGTTYIHFMFDSHEVVLSNGAWTESFQPGDYSLKGIGNAQRNEIFELFPELQGEAGREAYASARLTLKKHEAKLLFK